MSRPLYEKRSLAWLVAVDAIWLVPEAVFNLGSLLLVPACLLVAFGPIFLIQRRAGDSRPAAFLKALPCAVAAALPFPVCGTALGLTLLAFARGDSPAGLTNSSSAPKDSGK